MQVQTSADLARIVKTRRQAQALTQQDIADAVGITRQSLARIEHGHGGVSFDTVLRIFEKLSLHLDVAPNGQRHIAIPALNNDAFQTAASAARAAISNIDTSILLPQWQTSLNKLTAQLQDAAALTGSDIGAKAAHRVLLNAAIEAGDPDRKISTADREVDSRDAPSGVDNG